ncbi:MAG: flagella basal body P-ring formation protein FlgA [Proteobacteria bacterium]|nr:MAG: flagella basal body P-ring formation protein FlgA [Pseudomonadota bacterium]
MNIKTFVILFIVTLATPCFGLEVTFLAQAEVTGDSLTLGDIVQFSEESELAKTLASQVIAPAPPPGQTTGIDARQVITRIIKRNGPMDAVFWKGSSAISVTRRSIQVSKKEILQLIDTFLAENRNRLPQADISFKPAALPLPFQVPDGTVSYEVIPSNPHIIGSSRFTIICTVDGKVRKNFSVRGHLEAIAPVVVATRKLRYGDIIGPDMIELAPRDISRIENYITTPESVAGASVKRAVSRGTAIDTEAIEQPPMIKRGEFVKIIVNHNGMLLAATGIARTNGRKDDIIRVRNAHSNKLIFCRIQAPGIVEVTI